MYEEENTIFHLPTESTTVSDVKEVSFSEQPIELNHSFSRTEKLTDRALFDELNAVSEEVIKCRDRVLNKIS